MKAYYERNKWKWTVFTRERQAATLRATPVWYDRDLVGEVYRLAECRTKLTGIRWEVDHIVPLRGETVCGLHTLDNLRVIPAAVNRAKSNTWTGEVAPW